MIANDNAYDSDVVVVTLICGLTVDMEILIFVLHFLGGFSWSGLPIREERREKRRGLPRPGFLSFSWVLRSGRGLRVTSSKLDSWNLFVLLNYELK